MNNRRTSKFSLEDLLRHFCEGIGANVIPYLLGLSKPYKHLSLTECSFEIGLRRHPWDLIGAHWTHLGQSRTPLFMAEAVQLEYDNLQQRVDGALAKALPECATKLDEAKKA